MYNEHVASFPGLSPHVACNWDKPGNEITSSAMSQAVDLEDIKLDSEAEHEVPEREREHVERSISLITSGMLQ